MRDHARKVAALVVVALLSGCWWQPGYNAGRTDWNDLESGLTPATVGGLHEQWFLPLEGSGGAISHGGRIYVSANSVSGRTVNSIRSLTGEVVWSHVGGSEVNVFRSLAYFDGAVVAQYIIPGGPGPNGGLRHLDPATGAVLADETGAYPEFIGPGLAVADGVLAVPDIDGALTSAVATVSWKFVAVARFAIATVSPGRFAIVGDRILWSENGTAMGFSAVCPPAPAPAPAGSCAPDWTTEVGSVADIAAVGSDRVAYATANGLHVLETATGAIVCTAEVGGDIMGLAVAGDTVLITTGDTEWTGRLVAVSSEDCGGGSPAWEAPFDLQSLGARLGSPVVAGDVAYVANDGVVSAFDRHGCGAASCGPVASVTLSRGQVAHDLIVDNGRVIVTTDQGLTALGLG